LFKKCCVTLHYIQFPKETIFYGFLYEKSAFLSLVLNQIFPICSIKYSINHKRHQCYLISAHVCDGRGMDFRGICGVFILCRRIGVRRFINWTSFAVGCAYYEHVCKLIIIRITSFNSFFLIII